MLFCPRQSIMLSISAGFILRSFILTVEFLMNWKLIYKLYFIHSYMDVF